MREFVAVKQSTFVARYEQVWQAFDALVAEHGIELTNIPTKAKNSKKQIKTKKKVKSVAYPLVGLYRQICEHHALAKQRHYSPTLVKALHDRVMVGHELIYGHKKHEKGGLIRFIFYTFPARLHQYAMLFWISFVLLYLPMLLMGLACYHNAELIYTVMDDAQVYQMEQMYNPTNRHIGRDSERASDTDLMMFGHYIYNNISIDFRMYGSGLFAGIGTVFFALYNGVVIGAVAGHLTGIGYGNTFWQFVVGHGSFELMAAVIAGAAGLRLGMGVIAPAPYARQEALVVAGKESIQLLLGAAIMTFIAAFIEAFWSSSSVIPPMVKYIVAAILWTMVGLYLVLAGRGQDI